MEKEEFLRILKKYREGSASAEEVAFLHAYYKLLETGAERVGALSQAERERIKNEIREQLAAQIAQERSDSPRSDRVTAKSIGSRRGNLRRMAAAIAVLVTLSAGLYFYFRPGNTGSIGHPREMISGTVDTNDLAPGGNKAFLILSDGKKVVLSDMETGAFIHQGTATVRKKEHGQIFYGPVDQAADVGGGPSPDSSQVYNTVVTPRGGQYMVSLPDGTRVWLNAASSLVFQVPFTGRERRVRLKGEAYFEVTKDKARPFKVSAGGAEITVLGTHFNVMAYEDEPGLEATLLEGAVKITKNTENKVLNPGEQASIDGNGRIRITTVNTEEAIAWKNGYFLFDNEPLESLMRKISRWYDAEVIYQGDPEGLYFGGMVSRSKNISEILKIMELTANIRFQVDAGGPDGKGRRITVML